MTSHALDPRAAEKERYAALMSRGQSAGDFAAKRDAAPSNPATIPEDEVLARETVPGGWYWTGVVERGRTLRIVNGEGTPGVSVQVWNLHDRSERLNPADTVKVQWTSRIGKGRVLFSDMGRVLFSVTDDTGGFHDCVAGCSTAATNAERYGGGYLRNSRDNFLIAAAKQGMAKADVHPCITFFAGIVTDADGNLVWEPAGSRAGAHVDLRAEMDLLVVLSNCPHPLSPGAFAPKPVEVLVWASPPPAPDDLCRTATEEAMRGFENTDPLFAKEMRS